MRMTFWRSDMEFIKVFRIAYRARTHAQTVRVQLEEGGTVGIGEALGVSYRGETADSILQQLSEVEPAVRDGISREKLADLLGPGGARNAIDCALWDLESKRGERRAWQLAGMDSVRPLITSYTLGADSPQVMAQSAAEASKYSVLKLKMTGEADMDRVTEVRRARPDAEIMVDANQAWSQTQLEEFLPRLVELRVTLIEQPLPLGKDAALRDFHSPIPLCADESCQTTASLPELLGKYEYINIKLDKTGGLTEALRLAEAARAGGLKVMVGCMGGSSISMAPAFVAGQLGAMVDLDGPLLLKSDVPHGFEYQGSRMLPPQPALWG